MNRNLDWVVLTIVLVVIVASGIFVFMQTRANMELIQQQIQTSQMRFLSNRELMQKLADESKKRDEEASKNALTYAYKEKWCKDAMALNPGWTCPKE